MDDELTEAFEKTQNELVHLHRRWILYVQLFGTNHHRIDIINKTAPDVLVEFQWLTLDHLILSLSKLTDPETTCGKLNLSFNYLIRKTEELGNKKLAEALTEILIQLELAVKKFRLIRNKRIAHNDLVVALESHDSPLPGVSRAEITAALKLAGNFLNLIELDYRNSQTFYDMTRLGLKSDARALLIWLQKGLAYEKITDSGTIERDFWRSIGNIDKKND